MNDRLFHAQYQQGGASIDATIWLPPSVITIGGPAVDIVALQVYCGGPFAINVTVSGATCTSWQGTVQWISTEPAWRVALDLTCANGPMTLKGTFSGTE
jgi:hypothetical protein